MNEQRPERDAHGATNADTHEDEERIAEHLVRGGESAPEDSTRSTLHTGANRRGEGSDRDDVTGQRPEDPRAFDARTTPAEAGAKASDDLSPPESAGAPNRLADDVSTDPDPIPEQSTPVGTSSPAAVIDLPGQTEPRSVDTVNMSEPEASRSRAKSEAVPVEARDTGEPVPDARNKDETEHAPEDIALSHTTVAENAAGAMIGTLSVADPDAGDSPTFAVDDDRFEVVAGQLRLKPGIALDHEAEASVEVTVTATDSAGLESTQSFTLQVTEVNEAPGEIQLQGRSGVDVSMVFES
jgi:hypothetical protein